MNTRFPAIAMVRRTRVTLKNLHHACGFPATKPWLYGKKTASIPRLNGDEFVAKQISHRLTAPLSVRSRPVTNLGTPPHLRCTGMAHRGQSGLYGKMHAPDGCEIRAPFVSLLIRPPNTSDRAGRFGCALAVHMSLIPRSPGIETLRAAHHYRGYSMAGLLGVVHYGDTRNAHTLDAAR